MRQLETQPLVQSYNNRSVPKLFRSYLRNSNNKTNLVKYLFQKEREALPNALTSFQTIHLTNLDGATDRVTSQSSEIIDFNCDHEEAGTKMFACIKFRCGNIRLSRVTIVSPDMLG